MGHCCPHYFVSRRGFTARPQATFLSPTLPASTHIWQCVEASWLHPLKARAPVAGLVCFFRMQGHAVALFPSTPPLKEALAAQLLPQSTGWSANRNYYPPLPPLQLDRESLKYFGKIFQLFHLLPITLRDWRRTPHTLAVIAHPQRGREERRRNSTTVRNGERCRHGACSIARCLFPDCPRTHASPPL